MNASSSTAILQRYTQGRPACGSTALRNRNAKKRWLCNLLRVVYLRLRGWQGRFTAASSCLGHWLTGLVPTKCNAQCPTNPLESAQNLALELPAQVALSMYDKCESRESPPQYPAQTRSSTRFGAPSICGFSTNGRKRKIARAAASQWTCVAPD